MSEYTDMPRAVILSFPKRRGRPKSTRANGPDTGTPELVMKRLAGETIEALDLCLEREVITAQQHWCGIHLRWLYTLRHGAPGVRAINPTHLGGCEIKSDDPLWRAARELEYHEALSMLAQSGHAMRVMNLCVYNERPMFLKAARQISPAQIRERENALLHLRDGLDHLVKLWRRRDSSKS